MIQIDTLTYAKANRVRQWGATVPEFRADAEFDCEPRVIFDFLIRPANVVRLSPPDVQVRLLEGPPVVQLGSRVTIEARNFGLRQRFSVQITEWEENERLTDEQIEGPFRFYRHSRRLEHKPGGSRLVEIIEFSPPGGMLGMLLSAERLQRYLAELHEHRVSAMRGLLGISGTE